MNIEKLEKLKGDLKNIIEGLMDKSVEQRKKDIEGLEESMEDTYLILKQSISVIEKIYLKEETPELTAIQRFEIEEDLNKSIDDPIKDEYKDSLKSILLFCQAGDKDINLGKTTFVDVILRMHKIMSGKVLPNSEELLKINEELEKELKGES